MLPRRQDTLLPGSSSAEFDASCCVPRLQTCGDLPCREVYTKLQPGFNERCTAPLLVDKVQRKAVCNESGIMLDMLYAAAAELPSAAPFDLKPATMATEIDELNDYVYNKVNNATYRCRPSPQLLAGTPLQADCHCAEPPGLLQVWLCHDAECLRRGAGGSGGGIAARGGTPDKRALSDGR